MKRRLLQEGNQLSPKPYYLGSEGTEGSPYTVPTGEEGEKEGDPQGSRCRGPKEDKGTEKSSEDRTWEVVTESLKVVTGTRNSEVCV